jgi:hypothetical protein
MAMPVLSCKRKLLGFSLINHARHYIMCNLTIYTHTYLPTYMYIYIYTGMCKPEIHGASYAASSRVWACNPSPNNPAKNDCDAGGRTIQFECSRLSVEYASESPNSDNGPLPTGTRYCDSVSSRWVASRRCTPDGIFNVKIGPDKPLDRTLARLGRQPYNNDAAIMLITLIIDVQAKSVFVHKDWAAALGYSLYQSGMGRYLDDIVFSSSAECPIDIGCQVVRNGQATSFTQCFNGRHSIQEGRDVMVFYSCMYVMGFIYMQHS